jgi:hypothetical protein
MWTVDPETREWDPKCVAYDVRDIEDAREQDDYDDEEEVCCSMNVHRPQGYAHPH